MARDTKPTGKPVRAVGRTLDIIEAIAGNELGLVELARATGLSPSTAHRLVGTLMEREFVVQDESTGRYLLGYKLVELAEGVRRRGAKLEAVSRDVIAQLSKLLGESVNVAALDHGLPVYLAQADSERTMRMVTRVGQAVPLHSTAVGKAILAYLPADQIDASVGDAPYPSFTPATITARPKLKTELDGVREQGFAIEEEEHEQGLVSVAAPLFGLGPAIVGAINVSAPVGRVKRETLLEWAPTVVSHAAVVSERLGGGGARAGKGRPRTSRSGR